jgi:hypothetical protein
MAADDKKAPAASCQFAALRESNIRFRGKADIAPVTIRFADEQKN